MQVINAIKLVRSENVESGTSQEPSYKKSKVHMDIGTKHVL